MELVSFGTPSPESAIKQYNPYEGKIDYGALRAMFSEDADLWNEDLSLIQNTINLINACVSLPNPLHNIIVASFILQPSMLISKCGIMVCYGMSGSGKSVIGSIAAKIHNTQVLAGTSTYAAIRNALNDARWEDVTSHRFERPACLIFDDLKRQTFQNPDLYTFFRCGTDRATQNIQISSKESGINIIFPSFAPKMFSTISGFFFEPEFSELLRRLIVIPHKSLKQTEVDFIEPSDVNFESFRAGFLSAYGDGLDKDFLGVNKSLRRTKSINNLQWQITKPLISTLVHLGWGDTKACVELFSDYWESTKPPKSELLTLLEGEVNAEWQTHAKNCEYQGIDPYDVQFELDPATIKKVIDAAYSGGVLAEKPSGFLIRDTMAELGYSLKSNSQSKMTWNKVN